MSNPETFIDEVTEEVRRDKLFATMRKYGWIGVVGVVGIVGGAAVNEIMKARAEADAQTRGNAIFAALEAGEPEARVDALRGVEATGDAAALLAILAATETADPEQADRLLAEVADNTTYSQMYRDLATMKRVLMPDAQITAADKQAALEPLTEGGAFRTLAEEQLAYAELELGDVETARARLEGLLVDAEALPAQRDRVRQLIVALGGEAG